jgi:hypothetical protein
MLMVPSSYLAPPAQPHLLDLLLRGWSSYLCPYDLHGPVRNAFDAARIKSIAQRPVYIISAYRWFYVQKPTGGFRAHTTPPVRLTNRTALPHLPPSRAY